MNMLGQVHFKEIKYFSPDGKCMPNGISFQRGCFLHECKRNKDAFEIDRSVHSIHDVKPGRLGGIIVFSTDVESEDLLHDIKLPLPYSAGKAFLGQYVGDKGESYNKESLTIEVNGITTKDLFELTEMLSISLHPTGVIIKDLNTMRLYTAYEGDSSNRTTCG